MPQTHNFTFTVAAHPILIASIIDRDIEGILAANGVTGPSSTVINAGSNTVTLEYADGQTLSSAAITAIQTYLDSYTHNPAKLTADELNHARRNITFGLEMYRQSKSVSGNPDTAYWSTYLDNLATLSGLTFVKDPIPNAATKAVVDAEVGQTITDLGKVAFYLQYPGSLDASNVVQPTANWWPT